MMSGAEYAGHVRLDEQVRPRPGDGPPEVPFVAFLRKVGQGDGGHGHPQPHKASRSNVPRGRAPFDGRGCRQTPPPSYTAMTTSPHSGERCTEFATFDDAALLFMMRHSIGVPGRQPNPARFEPHDPP